ncbi:eukaryotic translation initiation factor 3 subunit M-like [Corticium candelabrum]|uniref:eukaryotic translation initiation factor 3 subunit M-like n=1 Tax=Corticium candelabrum TaxID=121492 RepID=UPI002E26A6C7|nr:eukaryotic translation initiation factor 3 subunit M-like [Corticium candelabrum]
MTASVTAFIDITEEEQAQELKDYLTSLGASFDETTSGEVDVAKIIQAVANSFSICMAKASDEDAESVLNCVLSFSFMLKQDEFLSVLRSLTRELSSNITTENRHSRFQLLNILYAAMDEKCPVRLDVWIALLRLSVDLNSTLTVPVSLKKLNGWLTVWKTEKTKAREAYHVLHKTLRHYKKKEASDVQVDLLRTYSADELPTASADAHQCIIDAVADPEALLLDHLLVLLPIEALKGTEVHELLKIFVSGTLSDYITFYAEHQTFIESEGLSHEKNLKKMRLLTIISLAASSSEVTFEQIAPQLKLEEDKIEEFVINGIRAKLIGAKINQVEKKVQFTSLMHRQFDRQQWESLNSRLNAWKMNISKVFGSIKSVVGLT